MDVGVIGTGYVGLVVGACLAESGNDVICGDVDERKIGALRAGRIPIYEPGLGDLVGRNTEAGRLSFTTDVPELVRRSDVIFIAVGTPPGEDGSADLRHVLDVARTIGESMNGEKVVITKSTVPVGTASQVREAIEAVSSHPVHVCSNPEFLKEGAAVDDFMKPDRVVVGTDSDHARAVLEELYEPFLRTGNPVLFMDVASAEITKYAANAMLATRISFMNTIARLCAAVGADVNLVRKGIGSDERIGPHFLFAGIGYGGSCFPKDVKALERTLSVLGIDPCILESVEKVNAGQKRILLEMVEDRFGSDLTGRRFAVWGLSFKPGTDDMREGPSLVVVDELCRRGAKVRVHDVEALEVAREHFGERVEYAKDNYAALEGADALLVLTEWQPYRRPDWDRVRTALARPLVLDGRNIYDPARMAAAGFEYHCVGRPSRPPVAQEPARLDAR